MYQNDETVPPSQTEPVSLPAVSEKNTKADIFNAYKDLVKKFKQQSGQVKGKQAEQKKTEEQNVVTQASQQAPASVQMAIANLKRQIETNLDTIGQQLESELKKLQTVQQAITIEEKNLAEVHDIKIAANTLADLITSTEELHEQSRIERERETEQYLYQRDLKRQQDEDDYTQRRAQLEKDLEEKRLIKQKDWAEREASLQSKEQELANLQARVQDLPAEVETAVASARQDTERKLAREYEHHAALTTAANATERELAKLEIANLQSKVAEQQEQISALNQQLQQALRQVETIARTSIEGASGLKALNTVNQIALEQAKGIKDS